ncbi:DUF6084 family protein [Kitasatospora sp. NPDC052896]|uniref:DUF6084 family protein n=1 Tax=Kitasatospora sp. NPDC052896 TaxID=3364061 RepID=UPI0037CB0A59
MTELSFSCTGVRADRYAAGPTLLFRLRIVATGGEPVHAIALRCQLRIEPRRRAYSAAEGEHLEVLFGERARWGSTLNPLQFAQVSLLVPAFTGEIEVDLVVPCSYDLDVAAGRYFHALTEGEVPVLLLFSGTAFTGPGGFRVEPVPWDREALCRLPIRVWREMIEQHFPGCGWLRLPRDTMDALLDYRTQHGLPSWEATMRALLGATGPTPGPPAGPTARAAAGVGAAGRLLSERTPR